MGPITSTLIPLIHPHVPPTELHGSDTPRSEWKRCRSISPLVLMKRKRKRARKSWCRKTEVPEILITEKRTLFSTRLSCFALCIPLIHWNQKVSLTFPFCPKNDFLSLYFLIYTRSMQLPLTHLFSVLLLPGFVIFLLFHWLYLYFSLLLGMFSLLFYSTLLRAPL